MDTNQKGGLPLRSGGTLSLRHPVHFHTAVCIGPPGGVKETPKACVAPVSALGRVSTTSQLPPQPSLGLLDVPPLAKRDPARKRGQNVSRIFPGTGLEQNGNGPGTEFFGFLLDLAQPPKDIGSCEFFAVCARVVELADTRDLKSLGLKSRTGSSPVSGTMLR